MNLKRQRKVKGLWVAAVAAEGGRARQNATNLFVFPISAMGSFPQSQTCEPRRGGVDGGDSSLTNEVALLRDSRVELSDDTERWTPSGNLFIFSVDKGNDFVNDGGTLNSIFDGGNTVFSVFSDSAFNFRGNFGVFNIVAYPPISSMSISPAVDKRKT